MQVTSIRSPETLAVDASLIVEADALRALEALPAQCAQAVVTSPPYWGLRDYGIEGQIGLEETLPQYLNRLVAVFAQVRRVLRDRCARSA